MLFRLCLLVWLPRRFSVDFNGVIVSTLLAHLFMDASIFVLDRTLSDPVCPMTKIDVTNNITKDPL